MLYTVARERTGKLGSDPLPDLVRRRVVLGREHVLGDRHPLRRRLDAVLAQACDGQGGVGGWTCPLEYVYFTTASMAG